LSTGRWCGSDGQHGEAVASGQVIEGDQGGRVALAQRGARLLVRNDLNALLIESKEKKAKFLGAVVIELGLSERGNVMDRQFSEVDLKDSQLVTARALDRFTERLPQLLKWSGKRRCLLFGGPDLEKAVLTNATIMGKHLMPFSERRYLYIVIPQAFGASN